MNGAGTEPYLTKPSPLPPFLVPTRPLQVIQYARRLPCYLNRQFITLLSTLGVPDDVIEGLYEVMLATLDKVPSSMR